MNKIVWNIALETIEPVEFISYDCDKYCEVKSLVSGNIYTVKTGYLFSTKDRAVKADIWFSSYDGTSRCPRSIDPYKYMLTRKEYARHRKERYKDKVSYCVENAHGEQVPLRTLDKAIKSFNSRKDDTLYLIEHTDKYLSCYGNDRVLVARDGDVLTFYAKRTGTNSYIKFNRIKEL